MTALSDHVVDHDEDARLDQHDAAAMRHAGIGRVPGIDDVDAVVARPLVGRDSGTRLPSERPIRNRLARTVNRDGVVRGGAAEVIAPFRFGGVAVSARINETAFTKDAALNAEQIRVAMTEGAEGPDVDDHLVRPALQNRVAA